MTEAEKMSHEISGGWYIKYGDYELPEKEIEKLICLIAERTAQRCARVYEERMITGKDVTVNFMVALIHDAANWVEEEVKK